MSATERLLADVPLHQLSVEQILAEAGVSRRTFYVYFGSKFAVVTKPRRAGDGRRSSR